MDEATSLPAFVITVAQRAANEGIPVNAISRVLQQPFEAIANVLKHSLALGRIGEMPKADWPAAQRWGDRVPSVQRAYNADDVEFACKKFFKLTPLESGFLTALMRMDRASKEKLYAVVEQRRMERPMQPDRSESPEQKEVDVVICKLRKKLRAHGVVIATDWGKGYYVEPDVKRTILALAGVGEATIL